jgi:GAF domain-containing protein
MEPSEKPLDPRLSNQLELVRTILGRWAEPVLVAYGNYTRHPELGPGLVKMLQVCCEAARQITNAVGAAITLGQSPNFIYVARSGKLVSSIGAGVNTESNFLGACVKSGRALISHSALTDLRVDPAVRQLGVKSLIAIPLVIDDHVRGVLEVCSLAENNFDTNKVVSLQFLAKLLRGALSEFQQSFSAPAHLVGLDAASAAPRGRTNAIPLKEDAARSHPQLQQGTEPPVSSSERFRRLPNLCVRPNCRVKSHSRRLNRRRNVGACLVRR